MDHIYQNFKGGWFTYKSYYEQLAKRLPNKCVFAEIGCWTGKAIAYLIVELINQGKEPKIIAVDTWKGSPEHEGSLDVANNALLHGFYQNTYPIKEYITPMCGDSAEMSKLIANNSLDGVFIDADHSYECSLRDIQSWYHKVKNGGIISGHDYYWNPGYLTVKRATDEFFGLDKVTVYKDDHGSCWEFIKND